MHASLFPSSCAVTQESTENVAQKFSSAQLSRMAQLKWFFFPFFKRGTGGEKEEKEGKFFCKGWQPRQRNVAAARLLDDCLHGKRNGRMEQVREANRIFLFYYVCGSWRRGRTSAALEMLEPTT